MATIPHQMVRRPLLTEKGTMLRETGGRSPKQADALEPDTLCAKICFEVAQDANKIEIRQAVEQLFGVEVLSVRTQVVRGKDRRLGRWMGRRKSWKKAIVTLAPGQSVDVFEGA